MTNQLFTDISLLARASLRELLENIEDPMRDLQEKISTLQAAWETGRRELAEAGNALSVYQEKEAAIQKQIDFHNAQAEKFADKDDVAYAHLEKAKAAEDSLARARKATAELNAELENQQVTVDAVAERLETLQKAHDKIKLITGRAGQLDVLRRVAKEEDAASELERSAVKKLYTAEARLELNGVPAPGKLKEQDPELLEKLAQLKKKKEK